jgi:hypothetical protein
MSSTPPRTYHDLLKASAAFEKKHGKKPTKIKLGQKALDELAADLDFPDGSLNTIGGLALVRSEDDPEHFEVLE